MRLGSRGVSVAYRLGRRRSGLGKPISEDDHYIVRVFYGGYYCEETLEGPYATLEAAKAIRAEQHEKGNGAIIYRCSNVTFEAFRTVPGTPDTRSSPPT